MDHKKVETVIGRQMNEKLEQSRAHRALEDEQEEALSGVQKLLMKNKEEQKKERRWRNTCLVNGRRAQGLRICIRKGASVVVVRPRDNNNDVRICVFRFARCTVFPTSSLVLLILKKMGEFFLF